MTARFITSFAELMPFAAEWQRWAGNIFQDWGFIQAFWAGHGSDLELRVIAVERDGHLAGLLPLQKRGSELEFLGTPEADAADLLCDEQDGAAVLQAALELLASEGFAATLLNVPEKSKLLRASTALPRRLRMRCQKVYRCPAPHRTLTTTDASNADQLRKLRRRLERNGPVTFRHLETAAEIRRELPAFFEQHIERAAAAGRASEFLSPARRQFFSALAEHLDPQRELRFAVVSVGAKVVAYHFGFQRAGRLVYYKPSFDVDFWDLSPGDILLRSLLGYAEESSLAEFDFSIGDEPYKRRFANDVRHAYTLHFTPSLIYPPGALKAVGRAVEHQVRKRPEWLAYARTAKERAGRFRKSVERLQRADRAEIYCLPGVPLEIKNGTLSRLANLCGHLAPETSEEKLFDCRRRLKAGDRFFLFPSSHEIALVWTREVSRVEIPELREQAADLPAAGIVAYECWTGSSLKRSRPTKEMLAVLAQVGNGRDVWFYLLPEDCAQREWLDASGVQVRYNVPTCTTRISLESPTETLIQQ